MAIVVQNGIKYIDLPYYGNATISGQSIWVLMGKTSIKSRMADIILIVGPKHH